MRTARVAATSRVFRVWAHTVRRTDDEWSPKQARIAVQAVAIELPDATGRRLVLLRGVAHGPVGSVVFVAGRLVGRVHDDGAVHDAAVIGQREEAAVMTDRELCDFGERLYEAVLFTPMPAATIFNLSVAVRQAIPWQQLPQHLKFAVFKIAASCVADESSSEAAAQPGEPSDTTEPAATAHEAPTTDANGHAGARGGSGGPAAVSVADTDTAA